MRTLAMVASIACLSLIAACDSPLETATQNEAGAAEDYAPPPSAVGTALSGAFGVVAVGSTQQEVERLAYVEGQVPSPDVTHLVVAGDAVAVRKVVDGNATAYGFKFNSDGTVASSWVVEGGLTDSSAVALPDAESDSGGAENATIVIGFVGTLYNEQDPDGAVAEYVAPDAVFHGPSALASAEEITAYLQSPDGMRHSHDVKQTIVKGNMVATISLIVSASDAASQTRSWAIDFYRLKDGRIVERWEAVQAVR